MLFSILIASAIRSMSVGGGGVRGGDGSLNAIIP
jgi:hypothetical protein